jgi:tetratricopeptide (TPR) repeat protein
MNDPANDAEPEQPILPEAVESGPAHDSGTSTPDPTKPAEIRKQTEAPDFLKEVKNWIWKRLHRVFGEKWTYILFAAVFVLSLAFSYRDDIRAVVGDTISAISQHRRLPIADPKIFTVGIVRLQDDDKGQMEDDILDQLHEVKGVAVEKYPRPPISDADVKAGNATARGYLKESKAQVLLWGRVITVSGRSVPKIYWTVSEETNLSKESGRYPLAEDLSLPPIFLSDLANVLKLLVATQGATIATDDAHYVADQLGPFISRVQGLVQGARESEWSSDDLAKVRIVLASAMETFGEQKGNTQSIEDSIPVYKAVLQEWSREQDPVDWAMTQNNLGTALNDLGERESGTTHLEQAVAAYRAALEERTRERVPLEWAMTQNNLGNALSRLGERESGTTHLEQAVAAYRAALEEYSRARVPLDWAMTQNNLAVALRELGSRERNLGRMCDALSAHISAWQLMADAPNYASIAKQGAQRDVAAIKQFGTPHPASPPTRRR